MPTDDASVERHRGLAAQEDMVSRPYRHGEFYPELLIGVVVVGVVFSETQMRHEAAPRRRLRGNFQATTRP
jgi:hypothetical protein